ncbi:MAG: DMT family transporter [Alphaproteobacteria bacterium]
MIVMTLFIFVSMDTLVKYLIKTNSAPQIIWFRFLLNMGLAAAIMLAVPRFRPHVRSNALGRQLLRSALLLTTTSAFFFGLRYLKLADLVILNQAAPLIVVVLSVVLLGEKVGPRRWLGVGIGFVGVVIILKPGFGFQWASLLGLTAALIYAVYQIMTRALSTRDHTMTTFFYTAMVGAVAMAPVAIVFWRWPSPLDFLLMCLPGLVGGIGHLLLIMAFARSEASLLAPYFYGAIVLATAMGWIFFGEVPDAFSFLGAGLIAAAGLYIWHRERQIAKRRGQVLA